MTFATSHPVFVTGNSRQLRESLSSLLGDFPEYAVFSGEPEEILAAIPRAPFATVAVAHSEADEASDTFCMVRAIQRAGPGIPTVLVTSASSEALAIEAVRAGLADYVRYPCPARELADSLNRFRLPSSIQRPPANNETELFGAERMIGASAAMEKVRKIVRQTAGTETTVLITGETGTGKELVAELIHQNSARSNRDFACINCAAIPDTLIESELFGYEQGAFTGAHRAYSGRLQAATGGTVFLDEIGEMSAYAQSKILRLIESKEIQRLGGTRSARVNVRVVAATNQALEELVAQGKFRKDLYFRLNVSRIQLPSLRERKEDLPLLLSHYLREANERLGMRVEGFNTETLQYLLRHDWPGNVRELKNVVEAILVNSHSRWICLESIPEHLMSIFRNSDDLVVGERERLISALFAANWNKSRAAARLRWSRMTLYRKIVQYAIPEPASPKRRRTPSA